MPELCVGLRRWSVPDASNLLDALNQAGLNVPYSCRAGRCHACLVRCLNGEPQDARPEALSAQQRAEGWRLACQCRVVGDLQVAPFDPHSDAVPARVEQIDWLGDVLRLQLLPDRALRYQAGQHVVLWRHGIARPYSLASVPGEDRCLAFHIDCRRPGAFCDLARQLRVGDELGLGELRSGALHYDRDWQDRPLWLLAAGTGLAPLWGILREAVRQEHAGPIRVLHLAHSTQGHYLAQALDALAAEVGGISVQYGLPEQLPEALAGLRGLPRQALALACGAPDTVEQFARALFMAGLPRSQLFADMFTPSG